MTDLKVAVLDDYMRIAGELADWSSLPASVHTDFFHEKLPDGTDARASTDASTAPSSPCAAATASSPGPRSSRRARNGRLGVVLTPQGLPTGGLLPPIDPGRAGLAGCLSTAQKRS